MRMTPTTPASVPDTAVLLVNLGTPDAPTAPAVRRYLAEFLHDHRVVALSRWLWCPILHFIILPLRGPKVAKKYAQIWMEGGSPLAVHTRDLAAAMQDRLPGLRVAWAMRYGNPSMAATVAALRADGVRRIVLLPLYPQYSTTTTASVTDVAERLAREAGDALRIDTIVDYHLDPAWIAAVADSIREHWAQHGRGERLLFSFHGIPQRLVDAGDPYRTQSQASVDAIVAALADVPGFEPAQAMLTFQSRFGREPWLQPYTDKTLEALAAQGLKRIDIVCPGFAVDCLETLEEITVENDALFRAAGGDALRYIPCLNAAPAHADALAALARRRVEENR
ncbi:ferrochelatase [Lysobacter hankyongensis]|uniref:Ferrochelatase n=2 Tax=Lysobacter hankyongensis TaxID=1176535 RepID=A0ABP9B2P6_9GAMM